jgi:polyketide synthase PksN
MKNKTDDLNFIREWIKETEEESADCRSPAHSDDPLVITGVSGFFPGCMDVGSFWDSIDKDESLITTIPRFDWRKHYAPTEQPGKMRTKWGGFIPDIASFDARFFNILPSQANEMDPRQRLLLTSTWHTLEDAGIDPVSLRQSNTGVFIGCESNEYAQLMRNKGIAVTGLLNDADSMLANRISYYFDFSGASEYTNTMCSGFAVALHRAVTAMCVGQIDRAIVGAANIVLLAEPFITLSQEGLLSTQNTVKSFGQDANGYLRSEGAGTILIERLSAAKKECRHIYAIIKHTSVNYNGQGGMSIAAPNTKSHTHLIKSCYQEAKIDPRHLTYIEAQGMGLPVADIAEWTAINRALTELCQEKGHTFVPGYCRVSTLKPMTGHMHAASSLGALLKIIRSFQTKKIHKVLDYKEPNEFCDMENTPCQIARETESWEDSPHARLAALHSYGAGGNNAHVLLEEYRPESFNKHDPCQTLICLSARTPEQLNQMMQRLHDYLAAAPKTDLANLSFTLNTGRTSFQHRCAMIVESIEELLSLLNKVNYPSVTLPCYAGKVEKESIIDLSQQKEITLKKLAIEWVNGASIKHIELLYSDQRVQRLAGLPGYPFEKRYCWFEDSQTLSLKEPVSVIEQYGFNDDDHRVLKMIQTVLGLSSEEFELETPFSELGIDSLSVEGLIPKLESEFNIHLRKSDLFSYSNIDQMRQHIVSVISQSTPKKTKKKLSIIQAQFPELVHLNKVSKGRPVFWFHAGLGGVQLYHGIAEKSQRPFYGIQARGWQTKRSPLHGIQAMAAYYVQIVRAVQPQGPYDLGGYSLGGILSYEIAAQLQKLGQIVNTITMLDAFEPAIFKQEKIVDDSIKIRMLQAMNFVLMSMVMQDVDNIKKTLIHRVELDFSLDDESFLEELVVLAKKRHIKKATSELQGMIKQMVKIQQAYEIEDFTILPLTDPQSVTCYYFRNRSGLFWGDLGSYYASVEKEKSLDHVDYWSMWKTQLPNFHVVDVDSSNHMMFFSEPKVYEPIVAFCEELYSKENSAKHFLKFSKKLESV